MNDMTIIEVRSDVAEGMKHRLEKLNARARRLKVTPVTVNQLTPWVPRFEAVRVNQQPVGQRHVGDFAFFGITVEVPCLAGWSFVATLEHTPAGNLVHAAPRPEGQPEIDLTPYRSVEPKCDHCHAPRDRKDTYVIRHEDGRTMQVGTNCLCDVIGLGASPEQIAAWAAWLSELTERLGGLGGGDSDYDGENFSRSSYVPTSTFVAYAVAVIREQGFVSRKSADVGRSPTVEDVWYNMEPPRGLSHKDQMKLIKPTEEDFARAALVIEWAKQIDPRTDFDHNLRCLASVDMMDRRNGGLAAYLPVAYSRAIEKELERKARAAASPSHHVGEIGKRIKGQKVTYVSTPWSGDTQYGMSYIHKFTTEDGSILIWKTGTPVDDDQGTSYVADFTPKAHTLFREVQQTEVLRMKLEVIPVEA